MRWLVLGALAVVGLSSVAQAQESARKWTGCYLGGHLGGAWGQNAWSNHPGDNPVNLILINSDFGSSQTSGWVSGVQLGCDYQIQSPLVLGVQGDFGWAGISGDHSKTDIDQPTLSPNFVTQFISGTTRINKFATMTGRAGYASERALFYFKGGIAWSHNDYDFRVTEASSLGSRSGSFTSDVGRWGWTVGAGLEYALSRSVSAYAEYNYLDFGNRMTSLACTSASINSIPQPCGTIGNALVDLSEQISQVKFGLNVRF